MTRISLGFVFKQALRQGYYRIATELGGPARSLNLRSGKVEVFKKIDLGKIPYDKSVGEELLKGRFRYAGQTLDIGKDGDPWTISAPSERFANWLHGFRWLENLAGLTDKSARFRARSLVDGWINVYGEWNHYAWDNDIIADRLLAWLVVWDKCLAIDSLSEAASLRRECTFRQLKRLKNTFNRTPEGLPKLKAASVLALGGMMLNKNGSNYTNWALDRLADEVDKQILPDGGHVSRSPETSLAALAVLKKVQTGLGKSGIESTKSLDRAIERLSHVINFFLLPDKKLAGFNGTGEDTKLPLKQLSKLIQGDVKPFAYCPHTGYQRLARGNTVIIVDAGNTPLHPYDLEAHLGPLSFEMATEAGRLIVNCGWNEEQPNSWRKAMRSTAAHSTVTLNDQPTGSLVSQGFKSKILGNAVIEGIEQCNASRKEQNDGIWVEASHKAYVEKIGLAHLRRIYMAESGNDIRGEDRLMVPIGHTPKSTDQIPFDIRFHLHPSVRVTLAQDLTSALLIQPGHVGWRFRTDGGPISIQDSVYLSEGHKPGKTQQIVISGLAFADSDGETSSNKVRWSFKRLENRK